MPQYSWDAILQHIASRLADASGASVDAKDLVQPPKADMGDVAFGCFALAKAQGKNPAEIAKALAAKLSKGDHSIGSASAAGPYVNITLKTGPFIERVIVDIEGNKAYGSSDEGQKRQILFEYANPNTHKELHVGHLRNIVLGVALVRILERAGTAVAPVSYINDVGMNVGKTLWQLVRRAGFDPRTFGKKEYAKLLKGIPKEKRNGNELGKVYTEAVQAIAADEALAQDVSFIQQQLEAHDPAWEALWRETRNWCIKEMDEIFKELGVRIERRFFESELLDRSQAIVKDLLSRGIAKESEGAVVADLDEDPGSEFTPHNDAGPGTKLGVAVLRKSDGTLLYMAKDLALAEWKLKEYPAMWKSWVLVDNRQSLYFRQLAAILRRMGVTVPFEYIGYELVTLAEGTMSSRKGNIVTFQGLRDAVVEYARAETIKRHEDWTEGKVALTAWGIAKAGITYGMLRQDADKQIVFDLERALSFDGDTGPYILYAATRLSAILKKGKWAGKKSASGGGDIVLLDQPAEKCLALHMARFPSVCRRAASEHAPHVVAQWCFAMAHAVTDFYRDVPVLDAPPAVRAARLRLVAAAHAALVNGLDLLGIPVPEEM